MSYNDQESYYLLVWLERERSMIGQRPRIYSFEQIRHSRVLPSLLQRIDRHFFMDIIEADFDYKLYFLKMEKYINEIEDMKFKKFQRQQLLEAQSISQLVKIILFMIMRSSIKQEFVGRILELEDEAQMYLMCEIKRVESWLASRMELKQVYQTIETLQEENELLNQKLKEIQARNQHVLAMKIQLQQENERLEEQNRKNNIEKGETLEMLGFSHPKEYTAIYKDLIHERNELIVTQTETEMQTVKLAEQNKEMQEKIVEDKFIIGHLNEEINKYREISKRLKNQSVSVYDFSKMEKENIDTECSITFESVRMVKSVDCSQENAVQYRSIKHFEQEQLGGIMHHYQEDLMSKLQQAYAKMGQLNNQISELKAGNNLISASNRNKEKMIRDAFEQFQSFSHKYQLSIVK